MNGKVNLKFGVQGRYELNVHKVNAQGEIISSRKAAEFENLITDAGLDEIGLDTTYAKINGAVVGTGTTTPANGDTGLAAYLAGTSTLQAGWSRAFQSSVAPYYAYYRITYRFNTGVAAGNLTEVGIGGLQATIGPTSTLFSRALILDGSGNPTTLTILSDEILDVTYELRFYLPNGGSDVTGTFNMTIDGVVTPFNYTLRGLFYASLWPADPTSVDGTNKVSPLYYADNINVGGGVWSGSIGSLTSQPTGTSDAWDSASVSAYTSGTYTVNVTYNLSLNRGNFSFISFSVGTNLPCWFQMQLDNPVTKDATKTFTITFALTWGRYVP